MAGDSFAFTGPATPLPNGQSTIAFAGWVAGATATRNGGPTSITKTEKLVRDAAAGPTGSHGPQHEYQVTVREPDHPITKGLPKVWMHAKDELYDSLRGPAEEMTILATAYSSPEFKGTDRDEPMLMVVRYGKGRVFHTAMGHADYSMRCVGFKTTMQRGSEWAATGKVTIPVPKDFPTKDTSSSWE